MQNKKILVMSILLMTIVLLGVGTIAYFRRTVGGNITGEVGNLVLVVNDKDASASESFNISLNRSSEEPYVLPDDKGTFNINIDSTGSVTSVYATVTITRTNLPDNLKFYLDENYKEELTRKIFEIPKSDSMTKIIPVYWFWDGSVDDVNDTLFMNAVISANINVSVESSKILPTLYETLIAKHSTLDTNVDFGYNSGGASESNGQGLMMVNESQHEEYPILYYRGDVIDNNVIYGDYCWLIVRTTETGGTKLIYNGEVNSDGSCNNYSGVGGVNANNDYLGAYIDRKTAAFNTSINSPVYVGYMYNDDSKHFSNNIVDVEGYTNHLGDVSRLDNGTGRYMQNKSDSNVKTIIDKWYENNIKNHTFESLLEDTVWCNDRYEASINDYMIAYMPTARTSSSVPSLMCNSDVDKFTVDIINGNGDLDYSIALLTADELCMAGNAFNGFSQGEMIITFLTLPNQSYWSMSPGEFITSAAFMIGVQSKGHIFSRTPVVLSSAGVRPSISLGVNATITGGNGTYQKPYRIDKIIN